ncbi:HAD family phosphatase [Candidatus Woesearchaeota archaeon]|nr:HAD family phosphatase [Candidatus Woesearchaeota archaeon]MBT5272370.1 HAD family phosphatase [Candidatus Woesearchaeota archaeon]MBT6040599.1 HAD family phosphatase [Candidatus Woesearchaeota archaeon]MBT6336642.1 HAD family phosphatase [Candidatus Woesearchaeota archaeon]MBT7927532.1 HAD family phosphatase [Candidatus Woesearchaeota archaeon]
MKITTVIFDYGKVLGTDSNEWSTTFKDIVEMTGFSPKELDEIFNRDWDKFKSDQLDLSFFWDEVCEKSTKTVKREDLEKVYEEKIGINQDVLEIAKELKKVGFRILVLANESRVGMDIKTRKFELDKIFDKIYGSAHIGLYKPNKEVFEYVLNDQNLKAEEVIFIDNLERNTFAAEELGIKGIVFKNAAQLKEDLEKFGIKV